MTYIDPDSPHEQGHDINGVPVVLGDTDTDGHFVGYIDDNGQAWEGRYERDVSVGSGRCLDAYQAWNRTGGALGCEPDYAFILFEHDVLPEHEADAMSAFADYVRIARVPMAVKYRDHRARLN